MGSNPKRWFESAAQKPARFLISKAFLPAIPLPARKWLVVQLGSHRFIGRNFLSLELLRDLAQNDLTDFHRFLWEHHVGGNAYAGTYEISRRFGNGNLRASRHELFEHLRACLAQINMDPRNDVRSVFDVGCSLGYALRFLETEMFPAATCVRGMDVDRYAIETGRAHLRNLGSKIELVAEDVSQLDSTMGNRKYDVVLCCGVLMYLDEVAAARAVRTMLAHTQGVLGLITLAGRQDNSQILDSYARPEDLGFVHNVEEMVQQAGGKVLYRQWTNPHQRARSPHKAPLFVIARPGCPLRPERESPLPL